MQGSPDALSTNGYTATDVLSKDTTVYNDTVSGTDANHSRGQVDYTVTGTVYVGGTEVPGLKTTFVYDETGRQVSTVQDVDLDQNSSTDDQELATTQTYNDFGRVVQSDDALAVSTSAAHKVRYEYDALGRQTKTIFSDGTSTQVVYDQKGRKAAAIDQLGRCTDYEYDVQGRLTAVTLPEIGGSGSDAHYRPRYEYGYDAYGNQATVVADAYLDGTTVYYQKYDSTGSLQSDGSRTLSAAPLVHGEVTRYAYDYAGRQISRTLPSGEVETFEYDGLGR